MVLLDQEEDPPSFRDQDLQVILVPTRVLAPAQTMTKVTTAEIAGEGRKKLKGDGKKREREA